MSNSEIYLKWMLKMSFFLIGIALKKIVYIHPPLGYDHLQIKKTLSSSSTFIWSPTSFLRLLLGYHIT
jgi:hypothetical protein